MHVLLQLVLLASAISLSFQQKCALKRPRDAQAALKPPANPGVDVDGANGTSISTPIPDPRLLPFNYANDKIRGVNLGGWFVLEPWITPTLFEKTGNEAIIDEYTLGLHLPEDHARSILEAHWNSWITEDDFIAIRQAGLNHVRLPIGYWSVPTPSVAPYPYITGAWPHIHRALSWASQHSLHVILDLHGAPGSQNGYDNSGQRSDNPRWALEEDDIRRTVDIIRFLAQELGSKVSIIQLLNEVAGFRGEEWENAVRRFWREGYQAIREAAGETVKVMIGDAFLGIEHWERFLTYPDAEGVMMDLHRYQIFSDLELSRSREDHISFVCGYKDSLAAFAGFNIWTVIGEWSTAITDCAKYLNGRGIGARWDNSHHYDGQYHESCAGYTGSWWDWDEDYKRYLRRYWEVQTEVAERVQGWVYWTWKAERADEWSYAKGLEGGWIPRDAGVTDRVYGAICT